jgi:hypothetical protein
MRVLIVGGGICGLGTSLLLARAGHDVTLFERDDEPVPASPREAWERWERRGVAQFRQPHNFMPGLRLLLDEDLPEISAALRDAGACRFDMLNPLPPTFADRTQRPIDDTLWTYTGSAPGWRVGICSRCRTGTASDDPTWGRGGGTASRG